MKKTEKVKKPTKPRRVGLDEIVRLVIKKHGDDSILCRAVKGIDHFGFGTFLCNLKPNEIKADKFAKDALLLAKEQSGLNGMEIWPDNRIAWGDLRHEIIISLSEISKAKGADKWLRLIEA